MIHAEVVLVEDNQAVCTIVTGQDDELSHVQTYERTGNVLYIPGQILDFAANDLAYHLKEIGWINPTGVAPPVVETVAEAETPYRILLGTAAIEEYGLQEEAESLSYPGYICRTIGNDLLIFGASSKGTANGIYGFLQEELGVRWFAPHELFNILPQKDRIAVKDLDRRVEPSYTGHPGVSTLPERPDYPWQRRMRLAEIHDSRPVRALEPFSGASHNVHNIVPYRRYFESHPEYFPMRSGRRSLHSSPRHTNLCWSNPDVVELAVEAARERFNRGKFFHLFSVGITDANAYCECEECVALQPEREFRGARVASDMYFHFVNEVARRIAPEFPDRYLGAIAYRDVTPPPLDEIEPNVFVTLALDISEHYDPSEAEADWELIDAWSEKEIPLGLYYYLGLAKLVPAYFARHLGETLQTLHERGFRALRAESYPGWPWFGPMIYLDAQLRWDIDQDVDELLDEYFTTLYGPAAPHVAALFDLLEEIHMRPRVGGFLYEHYNYQQFRPYTAEDLELIRGHIAAANDAIETLGTNRLARSNLEERRLAYTTQGIRLFLDMLEGVVLARETEAQPEEVDDFDVMEGLVRIDRINTLLARHEQVYRESIMLDPLHAIRYRTDTATPVRTRWKNHLSSAVGGALARYDTRRDTLHERTRAALDRAIEEYTRDPQARAIFEVDAGRAQVGENLAVNPGFEELDEDGDPVNWSATPASRRPRDSHIGTVEHSPSDPRFGERSGRMAGITGAAWMLQTVSGIEPGAFYLFEIDAHLNLFEMPGAEVMIRVEWHGREVGRLRGPHRYEASLETFNEWDRIRVVGRAPEGADRAQVFLRVENLGDGDEVWFDNLSVRRLLD